jgi:ADP-ribose pyrophosphatase
MTEPGQIGSRRIHTGRIINLDLDDVRFPGGTTGSMEIIRHPGASATVPVLGQVTDAEPHVLLIRQYRYAADGFVYEIPAGRLDPGETPEACASRELLEETGCTADRITFLTSMWTTPGFTDERIHLFMAEGLHHGESSREADEFIELVPKPLSEALAMIEKGEIQDAKTAVALLFAAGFRARR